MAVRNLIELLERAVAARPDRAAVVDASGPMTFAQLQGAAARLGAALGQGAERRPVGILLPAGSGFAVSFFAALMAGRVPVPLNLLLSPAELKFCTADAGLDLVLTASPLAEAARALAPKVVEVDRPSSAPVTRPVPHRASPGPDEPAVILYTSGTTARPKGVVLTHGNLLANAEGCREALRLGQDLRVLGLLPYFHALGLMTSLILPVSLGATAILTGRFQPAAVLEAIARHRPNVMVAVPSMYGALVRTGALRQTDTAGLDFCISGGEPLPAPVAAAFAEQTGREILEGYGLTETSPVAAVNRPGANRPGTVGPPLVNVEMRLVAEDGTLVPAGVEGHVLLRGPSVTPGYHNRPGETAQAFTADGWFKTGDLGRVDECGCLALTGRLKDLIITSGEKVSPRDVEEVMLRHPSVVEAAVIGFPDGVRGEVPKAFVVLREGASAGAADLAAFCREHLAHFKVPRHFEVRPELPKGPTGKVDRRALREEDDKRHGGAETRK